VADPLGRPSGRCSCARTRTRGFFFAALLRRERRSRGAEERPSARWKRRPPRGALGGLQGLRGNPVRAGSGAADRIPSCSRVNGSSGMMSLWPARLTLSALLATDGPLGPSHGVLGCILRVSRTSMSGSRTSSARPNASRPMCRWTSCVRVAVGGGNRWPEGAVHP